jgi:hypothetical protein
MSKKFVTFAAAVAALLLASEAAQAGPRDIDNRLTAVSNGVGAGMTAALFAINDWNWKWNNSSGLTALAAIGATTIGCVAISPMVASAVLHRPLTQREATVLFGSCVVPIVGGWLVEAAYEQHPEWEPAAKPAHHKKHAKM